MPPGGWGDGLGASIGWLMTCWYIPLPWVGRPVLKRRRPRHPQLELLDVRLLWGRRVAENLELGWQRAPVGVLLTRVVQRSVRRRSVVMVGPGVPQ